MIVVVELQGHQYMVEVGDYLYVDKIKNVKNGDVVENKNILLAFEVDKKDVKLGKPYINGVVEFEVKDNLVKGKKIKVVKFKKKNRYHKTIGFRPKYTLLYVKNIKVDE